MQYNNINFARRLHDFVPRKIPFDPNVRHFWEIKRPQTANVTKQKCHCQWRKLLITVRNFHLWTSTCFHSLKKRWEEK